MRASWNWLKSLSGVAMEAGEAAERLTAAGLEVEGLEVVGEGLRQVVIAEVRASGPHPKRPRLSVVTVFDGQGERQVVCGAPNVPAAGGRVLLALPGAELPTGMRIEAREVAGVRSEGMLCSEAELDLGPDESGIVVLGPGDGEAPAGTPLPEAIEGVRDVVLELGITPNRADAFGHVGLARELRAVAGLPFEPPSGPEPPERAVDLDGAFAAAEQEGATSRDFGWAAADSVAWPQDTAPVSVRIEAPARCPRYAAALVLEAAPRPSPLRVRMLLHRLGVRPIDAVVDATNLVLLEEGHPVHAFDLDRLHGHAIVVRLARAGEKLRTLDGVERVLDPDDLLICDAAGPVALAGVMGGENSEVHAETRRVLIECAVFEPRSVRRTARRHGLHTEASHRFERGVDPLAVPRVLARTAARMAELAGGRVAARWLDVQRKPHAPAVVPMRPQRLVALLGAQVPTDEAVTILERLGCEVDRRNEVELRVTVPSWRADLRREQDLFEEVARLWGYDRIPAELPRVLPSGRGVPPHLALQRRLREAGATAGLLEAVGYAFVSEDELRAARVPTERAVRLANPLSEERAVLRTSLLPGLAAAARRSVRRQVARIRLLEIGRVFFEEAGAGALRREGQDEPVLPPTGVREEERLAVLLLGPRPGWPAEGPPVDVYDVLGAVQQVIEGATGRATHGEPGPDEARPGWAHPRRWGRLRLGERAVGTFGELHPEVVEALELVGRPQYAEVSLEALHQALRGLGLPQARPLPRQPAVMRDLAVVVPEGTFAAEPLARRFQQLGAVLEDAFVVDEYRGRGIPEGHRSLAIRLVLREERTTLTDARAEALATEVLTHWQERFGAQLRGSG